MKIYKLFLVITVLLIAMSCYNLWRVSNRDELIKDQPIKEATLIEKREIPTNGGYRKVFHVVWTKHPSKQNLHDEFNASVNDYYKFNKGEKLTYSFDELDYPVTLQWNIMVAWILSLVLSGGILLLSWLTDN
ncbi:MAG: hypothetical protein RL621_57 [Bacteroidota bacterium]|jgi:hypothetical protein